MFSVVIPLYNKELSIENTINSVLEQTCQSFEIIVVNDGSTDQSAQVVEAIQDPRIHIIHQDNQGVSAARNRGIKEAGREWIAFLDGDDLWENDHLEEICKMMSIFQNEKVFVTSFEYSDKRKIFKFPRKEPIFKIENYFREAIQENLIWTSIIVIHSECFKKIGEFNIKLSRGEDLDLWARLAKSFNIIKSNKITAIYRIDAENRTGITKNIKKTHVYYLPIKDTKNIYEKKYYKYVLFTRLISYLKRADLRSFIIIITNYHFFFQIEFIFYLVKKIFNFKKNSVK